MTLHRRASRTGGILLIIGGFAIGLVLWMTPQVAASSTDAADFDGLVHTISSSYQVRAKSIPMMWLANLAARSITSGGVRGMRMVQFEDVNSITADPYDPSAFANLVAGRLSPRWSPIIRTHEPREGTFIYARADDDGTHARLIVVTLEGADHPELNLIAVTLDANQLAKFIAEHNRPHTQAAALEP